VAAVCALITLMVGRPDKDLASTFVGYTPLQLVGVGASATLGQVCLTHAFASGAPARVSIVGLTQIIFSLIVDVTVFHISFDLNQPATQIKVVGMALILVPSAAMMLRRRESAPE
jgi:drug/metabolite transporter (DMT)-like permease